MTIETLRGMRVDALKAIDYAGKRILESLPAMITASGADQKAGGAAPAGAAHPPAIAGAAKPDAA